MASVAYAELHAHSAFSFLDGASLPRELVRQAARLGLSGLAITDHDGFPGLMQTVEAADTAGLPVIAGTELALEYGGTREGEADSGGEHLVFLARNREGYRRLSHEIGTAMLESGAKGRAHYTAESLGQALGGQVYVLTGCRKGAVRRALESTPGLWAPEAAARELERLAARFGRNQVIVEITNNGGVHDGERCELLVDLAKAARMRYVATGNVHYAQPQDKQVADILAATRAKRTLEEMNPYLPMAGAYLRSPEQMRAVHASHLEAVAEAGRVGAECAFDMALIAPRMPEFPVPAGYSEGSWLRELTYRQAEKRYGPRTAYPEAWALIDHELDVIIATGFPGYFLIVEEIVAFCRSRNIWCQGRGSAANSAVCFALGITPVDAVRHHMLFERFLSPGRTEPPDIDLDIESGRREEVIQHVYERYGRSHAAQVANAITYRPRSAIRDTARALGYDSGQADRWASSIERRHGRGRGRYSDPTKEIARARERARERTQTMNSYDASDIPSDVTHLASRLQRLPRHLGIHSGGMVLCAGEIIDVCPVGWASKEGRTILQWDKDDCAHAGLVKFDLLGLGMLTALRLAFTELEQRGTRGGDGKPLGLHNLPPDDREVYQLLQAADTVGVFQVESRAQMATLPRLKPECFYDLVIEVALIRPGPIQGQSVNPYLRRRRGHEEVTYPHPLLRPALEKTLGVPLFQEQLMRIAMDAAGFSAAQADQLRKAMGSKRSHERVEALRTALMEGMNERGIPEDVSIDIYEKLHGFAEFGFPESHAFSFAYLVYASAWLKVHHPEEFYYGLLASQPMGFYSPQTLVADARTHGVVVQPPCVQASQVGPSIQEYRREAVDNPYVHPSAERCVRLGLSSISGLGKAAERIVEARDGGPFTSLGDCARRARLGRTDIEALARAGALASLGIERREGIWRAAAADAVAAAGPKGNLIPLPGMEAISLPAQLAPMSKVEEAAADIEMTGISADSYPTQFFRNNLSQRGIRSIASLEKIEAGQRVSVAGIVTHRQRPYTAQGITFLSLQDETGLLNVVCSPGLWARYRDIARESPALIVRGIVERADDALNLVADKLEDFPLEFSLSSRDFR